MASFYAYYECDVPPPYPLVTVISSEAGIPENMENPGPWFAIEVSEESAKQILADWEAANLQLVPPLPEE